MATNQLAGSWVRLLRKVSSKLWSSLEKYLAFLRAHPAMILFGLLFIVPMSLIYIPYQEKYFELQKSIEVAVAGFYGWTTFPAGFISLFLPSSLQGIATVGALFVTGTILGRILQMALKGQRVVKLMTVAVIIINSASTITLSLIFGNSRIGSEYSSCISQVTNDIAVRIAAYPEEGVLAGAHFFFSVSRDGGVTWEQFMHFRHDAQVDPPCDNIKFLNTNHIWAWMGWKVAVTQDGGSSWYKWEASDSPLWYCCNYGLVEDVSFHNADIGQMHLDPISGRGEVESLSTQNGGRSWR